MEDLSQAYNFASLENSRSSLSRNNQSNFSPDESSSSSSLPPSFSSYMSNSFQASNHTSKLGELTAPGSGEFDGSSLNNNSQNNSNNSFNLLDSTTQPNSLPSGQPPAYNSSAKTGPAPNSSGSIQNQIQPQILSQQKAQMQLQQQQMLQLHKQQQQQQMQTTIQSQIIQQQERQQLQQLQLGLLKLQESFEKFTSEVDQRLSSLEKMTREIVVHQKTQKETIQQQYAQILAKLNTAAEPTRTNVLISPPVATPVFTPSMTTMSNISSPYELPSQQSRRDKEQEEQDAELARRLQAQMDNEVSRATSPSNYQTAHSAPPRPVPDLSSIESCPLCGIQMAASRLETHVNEVHFKEEGSHNSSKTNSTTDEQPSLWAKLFGGGATTAAQVKALEDKKIEAAKQQQVPSAPPVSSQNLIRAPSSAGLQSQQPTYYQAPYVIAPSYLAPQPLGGQPQFIRAPPNVVGQAYPGGALYYEPGGAIYNPNAHSQIN